MIKFINYILIILFSVGSLIPHSDLVQFQKISKLMNHYELHQQENLITGTETNFFEFLVEHILEEPNHSHSDSTSHDDLPFQKFSTTSNLYIAEVSSLYLSKLELQISKSLFLVVDRFRVNSYEFSIFHPPIV